MKTNHGLWFSLSVISALIVGLVGGGLAGYFTADYLLDSQSESASDVEIVVTEEELSTITIVQQVSPAVVKISSTGEEGAVLGSGVIIDERGYIVTNKHVAGDYTTFNVTSASGEGWEGTIVGSDYPFVDLAVIKIVGSDLPVASLADSDALVVGQKAIAIGNPLGELTNSATVGIVSGLDRRWEADGIYYEGLIQTDAAINPGNSGGPLVNSQGEVIGINTMVARTSLFGEPVQGIGFAIPSNTVMDIATQIIENGYVARPYIGISHRDMAMGALILSVAPDTPAAEASLEISDIILKIGDYPIDEENPLLNVLMNFSPGETVILTITRGSTDMALELTFIQRP